MRGWAIRYGRLQTKRRRKFGNNKTVYEGKQYDSKKEAFTAQDLDILKKAGEITYWESHYRITLMVNGEKICDIIPDFYVEWADGKKELIEVKSRITMTPVWNLKRKLLFATYLKENPDIEFRVVV